MINRSSLPAFHLKAVALSLLAVTARIVTPAAAAPMNSPATNIPAQLFPLSSVRLLESPFTAAAAANRTYLLAHDPDRLLAPFFREAGMPPKARPYGNWESSGLDGHTAGHYLSALATMIASGNDSDGELRRRLDYLLDELERCQQASGDGYLGGVPGSRALWKELAAGNVEALNRKWVPWYNVHKTFAGLRDAYLLAGCPKARPLLVALGDWAERVTDGLSEQKMQQMLGQEHGGMNESFADLYAITGEEKYLRLARRFCHRSVLDPMKQRQDQLTGRHANTIIPKVVGLERIATLAGDREADAGARFFWETVTQRRSVAFGGNSVAEHFNDPKNFKGLLEHRQGPETCNTYNMLRLTEQLFVAAPAAIYADYYERALYNHILASIHPTVPGYVYFTPIRPAHYRNYSQPEQGFWCCVGTGMENPGRYGQFIYTHAPEALYVNLFIPSELTVTNLGVTLRQETKFPDEARTRLELKLKRARQFALHLRHPGWVATNDFQVRVNGKVVPVKSQPASYAVVEREWRDGDRVEIELPMRTTVERLPDGSDWVALLRGPIVLVAPSGTNNLVGLRADDTRMGHVAHGPVVSLDQVPVLLASASDLPQHVQPDPAAGPMRFRLMDVVAPSAKDGVPLLPFFRLHDQRYQMYWQLTTKDGLDQRRERLAAIERARAAREAATLDWITVGEQQPEVEHDFVGGKTGTGLHDGRSWRRGDWFQYTLDPRGETSVDLAVTYWGGERDRAVEIFANGKLLATQVLNRNKVGEFFEQRYPVPADVLAAATNNRVTIKFAARQGTPAGAVYEVRLMRPEISSP